MGRIREAVVFLPLVSLVVVAAPRPDESHLSMSIPFFDEITFWHWLIAGVILAAFEILAPGVVFMWLGIASLITGVIAWALPDLSLEWQLVVFAVLSMLSVVGGRMYMKRNPKPTDHPTLSRRGEQYIGRRFILSEAIHSGYGKIKVDDSVWKVSGDDMAEGTKVEVVAVEGAVFKVVEARD